MSKIEYDIYQIKQDEQFHGIRFEGTRFLKHAQIPIHPEHYDKIYSDKMNTDKPITGNQQLSRRISRSHLQKRVSHLGAGKGAPPENAAQGGQQTYHHFISQNRIGFHAPISRVCLSLYYYSTRIFFRKTFFFV